MARITFVICLAEVLGMASFAAYPTLLPAFAAEWGLNNTQSGWINGIYYAGYVVAVIVMTRLTDRFRARDVYLVSTMIAAASSLGFALYAEGFWSALAFRSLAGVGLAGTYMPGLGMLRDFLSGGRRTRFIAFYTSSFGIGASVSIFATGQLDALVGWQAAFMVLTAGPLLAACLILLKVPRGERAARAGGFRFLDFGPVLRCRPAMAYVLAYTCHNFELFALRGWTVAYLAFAAGLHPEVGLPASAAVLAAVINLVGVPASIVGNEFAMRFGRHKLIAAVMLSSAAVALATGTAASWGPWLMIAALCLYSATVAGESASVTAGAVEAAPEGYRGATMAVHSSIAFAGAFLGPLGFGIVLDLTGGGLTQASWFWGFALMAAVVALGPLALRLSGDRS